MHFFIFVVQTFLLVNEWLESLCEDKSLDSVKDPKTSLKALKKSTPQVKVFDL